MPKIKSKKKKKQPPHTNVLIDHELRAELYAALKRRAELAKVNGQVTATSFGGWVREQAIATIAAFR